MPSIIHISCEMHPKKKIFMKCQALYFKKNKENKMKMLSAKYSSEAG